MSAAIMEAQLRDALRADRRLAAQGWQAEERQAGGVAVGRAGIVAGVWHWRNGAFEVVTDRAGPGAALDTVAEAVKYTRDHLCAAP